jgi:protein O-GlcNAc transferase
MHSSHMAGTLKRAILAHRAGNLSEAEFLYRTVLSQDKTQFDALHMLGVIAGQRGNYAEALRLLTQAVEAKPDSADARINLGRLQTEFSDYDGAAANYEKALVINAGSPLAHNNYGALLRKLRRLDKALSHCENAIAILPTYADAWNNRGNILFDLNRLSDALTSYEQALQIRPGLAESLLGRGNVFHALKRSHEALAEYDKALTLQPELASAWFGRGNVFLTLARYEDAFAAYDKAIAINPLIADAAGFRLHAKMQICIWDNLTAECSDLLAAIQNGVPASHPFPILAMPSSPADQLKCAQLYSARGFRRSENRPSPRIAASKGLRRIAYLSADFHDHPTASLAAGLFENHDRSRFETTAISIGHDEKSEMRERLEKAFDRFIDARLWSDDKIVEEIRRLDVDIAIDLKGFTQDARPNIFASRAAPIQVSYLGYPGTMGAAYIDYIMADRFVVPEHHQQFYSEKIAWLPDSYQVNDSKRRISENTPTRSEVNLPPDGFVFCSFNNSFKIYPDLFSIWMRLLGGVDGSVLWLLEGNAAAPNNLCREAEKYGISDKQLIFAPRIKLEDHLARYRLADLFLDTLPYNAHTTASDALWAGLPVLTCAGPTFAGRVAGSLLTAIGLSELITNSLKEYEAMALKLAREPLLHASLRGKLAKNRDTAPLFNTMRTTRHIEAAYLKMWDRHERGEEPVTFAVDPLD